MERYPNIKSKLLNEILPAVQQAKDNIVDNLDYDTVMDFDYLQKCFYEVLRIEPPVPVSGAQNMSRSIAINGIEFKKSTLFFISIYSLHHDPL